MLSGEGRGGGVLSGEKKGGGSHTGEWRGGGVLSGARARGKATAVTRAGRENSETVAKQKQLPSAGIDSMCAARA